MYRQTYSEPYIIRDAFDFVLFEEAQKPIMVFIGRSVSVIDIVSNGRRVILVRRFVPILLVTVEELQEITRCVIWVLGILVLSARILPLHCIEWQIIHCELRDKIAVRSTF